jgi:hypothetical protein
VNGQSAIGKPHRQTAMILGRQKHLLFSKFESYSRLTIHHSRLNRAGLKVLIFGLILLTAVGRERVTLNIARMVITPGNKIEVTICLMSNGCRCATDGDQLNSISFLKVCAYSFGYKQTFYARKKNAPKKAGRQFLS